MNHKIKQICQQKADYWMNHYDRKSKSDMSLLYTDIEKFAELLIKECISCVGSQADKAYLKKHFGLPVESDIVYPATDESWSVETQYKRKYNIAPDRDMGGI